MGALLKPQNHLHPKKEKQHIPSTNMYIYISVLVPKEACFQKVGPNLGLIKYSILSNG
jgi:hypothetical protein